MESETRKVRMEELLMNALKPSMIEVIDQSHLHAGHSGARPSGETHYKVKIRSKEFTGLGYVEQHRRIYSLLDRELKNGLHALEIDSGTI